MSILIDDKVFEMSMSHLCVSNLVDNAVSFISSRIEAMNSNPCDIHFVAVADGAIPFASDIMSRIDIDHNVVGFSTIKSSSYKGMDRGVISLGVYNGHQVKDKDVIVIEDIIDTGCTIDMIIREMKASGAKSVTVVSFLNKAECRIVDLDILHPDVKIFSCNIIKNLFVVGYGLDYNSKGRWLSSIYQCTGDVNIKYKD